jgi:hypothetical protein
MMMMLFRSLMVLFMVILLIIKIGVMIMSRDSTNDRLNAGISKAISDFFTMLRQALPSGDVFLFYAGVAACGAFILYIIFVLVIQRKPLNIDTIIKENRYMVVRKHTVAAFCLTAALTVFYYGFYANTASPNAPPPVPLTPAEKMFKLMLLGLLACFAYVAYQGYKMLTWSITNTPHKLRDGMDKLNNKWTDWMGG